MKCFGKIGLTADTNEVLWPHDRKGILGDTRGFSCLAPAMASTPNHSLGKLLFALMRLGVVCALLLLSGRLMRLMVPMSALRLVSLVAESGGITSVDPALLVAGMTAMPADVILRAALFAPTAVYLVLEAVCTVYWLRLDMRAARLRSSWVYSCFMTLSLYSLLLSLGVGVTYLGFTRDVTAYMAAPSADPAVLNVLLDNCTVELAKVIVAIVIVALMGKGVVRGKGILLPLRPLVWLNDKVLMACGRNSFGRWLFAIAGSMVVFACMELMVVTWLVLFELLILIIIARVLIGMLPSLIVMAISRIA